MHRAADPSPSVSIHAELLTREQGKYAGAKGNLFGIEVIHFYAEEGRRLAVRSGPHRAIFATSSRRPVGVVGGGSFPELPSRPLCLEGRPPFWRPRRCTLVAAAMRRRAHWHGCAMFCRCRPSGGRAERYSRNRGESAPHWPNTWHPHDNRHSIGSGRAVDHARGRAIWRLSTGVRRQCPFIVLDDADPAEAAAAAVRRSSSMGQICIVVNRILGRKAATSASSKRSSKKPGGSGLVTASTRACFTVLSCTKVCAAA